MRVGRVDSLGRARLEQQLPEAISSPGPHTLGILSMQHNHAIADLVWLQMVQFLGEHEANDPAIADRIERWSNVASDLDPLYFAVQYYPAVVLVSYSNRVEASDRVADKGEKNLPTRWEFPFLRGYNAYFVRGEPEEASGHWMRSASRPRVPQYVPSLVARAKFQSGNQQEAMAILQEMMQVLPEGPHRKDAEIRLKMLQSEVLILTEYDAACASYKEETGHLPTPLQLYQQEMVKHPPEDLFGNAIELDENCRARTELITVREDEAAKRIGSHGVSGAGGADAAITVDGG